jgi:hypothetical protein
MLLPFRPTSDTSASRNFVRNFFKAAYEGTRQYSGEGLAQELRLTEPLVGHALYTPTWGTCADTYRHSAVSSNGAGAGYPAAS